MRPSPSTPTRDTLATQADLAGLESRIDAKLEALEGRIYRALWIQGIGIVAIIGGFIAIAGALSCFDPHPTG